MNAGDTFLYRSIDEHLWMVISDPVQDPHHIVIVNLTTWKGPASDQACVIDAGDHPFVRHRSYVYYQGAKVDPLRHLNRMLESGGLVMQDALTTEQLARVRQGAGASIRTPSFAREILAQQGLIELDP